MQSHAGSRGNSGRDAPRRLGKHFPRKIDCFLGRIFKLTTVGANQTPARCRRGRVWRLYRGRRVSGKPDTDMTSHPNNKSAEMSSAIDISVLCRNVALTVAPMVRPSCASTRPRPGTALPQTSQVNGGWAHGATYGVTEALLLEL
jgi:hypothetical protein